MKRKYTSSLSVSFLEMKQAGENKIQLVILDHGWSNRAKYRASSIHSMSFERFAHRSINVVRLCSDSLTNTNLWIFSLWKVDCWTVVCTRIGMLVMQNSAFKPVDEQVACWNVFSPNGKIIWARFSPNSNRMKSKSVCLHVELWINCWPVWKNQRRSWNKSNADRKRLSIDWDSSVVERIMSNTICWSCLSVLESISCP